MTHGLLDDDGLFGAISSFVDRLRQASSARSEEERLDFDADVVAALFACGVEICRRARVPDAVIVECFKEHIELSAPAVVKKGGRKCVD